MAIRFNCTQCGQGIAVAEHLAGQRGMCPHCRTQIIVPPQAPNHPSAANRPSSLADWLTFKRMVTPMIIQGLFAAFAVLAVVGMVLIDVYSVYRLITEPPGDEKAILAITAVTSPLWTALVILIARLYAELLIVIFRINETLTDVLEELRKSPRP